MLTAVQEQVYSLNGRLRIAGGDGCSLFSGLDWWPFGRTEEQPQPKAPPVTKFQPVRDIPRCLKVVTSFNHADTITLCQKWRNWMGKCQLYSSYTIEYCKSLSSSLGHMFALLGYSNPHYLDVLAIGHAFVSDNELLGSDYFDITTLVVNPAYRRQDFGAVLLESMMFFALCCNHPDCHIHVPDECFECLSLCDAYGFEECRHFEQELVRQDDHDLGIFHSTVAYTTLRRLVTRPYEPRRFRPDFVYRHNFPGKLVT